MKELAKKLRKRTKATREREERGQRNNSNRRSAYVLEVEDTSKAVVPSPISETFPDDTMLERERIAENRHVKFRERAVIGGMSENEASSVDHGGSDTAASSQW